MGKLVRSAEKDRIPYTAVVGQKEKEGRSLSLRSRGSIELGSFEAEDVIKRLNTAIENNTTFVV